VDRVEERGRDTERELDRKRDGIKKKREREGHKKE
jgi:hypothetical protein